LRDSRPKAQHDFSSRWTGTARPKRTLIELPLPQGIDNERSYPLEVLVNVPADEVSEPACDTRERLRVLSGKMVFEAGEL
jgi:hypothetical protein